MKWNFGCSKSTWELPVRKIRMQRNRRNYMLWLKIHSLFIYTFYKNSFDSKKILCNFSEKLFLTILIVFTINTIVIWFEKNILIVKFYVVHNINKVFQSMQLIPIIFRNLKQNAQHTFDRTNVAFSCLLVNLIFDDAQMKLRSFETDTELRKTNETIEGNSSGKNFKRIARESV